MRQILQKIYVLAVVFGLSVFQNQISAQAIYADFETVTPTVTVFNDCVYSVETNPDKTDPNTSDNVGKYITATNQWDGLYWDLDEGFIDFTNSKVFTMMIKSDYAGDVIVKLENSSNSNTYVEVWQTYSGSGNWEEVSFDFTSKSPANEMYNRVVLLLDADAVNDGNIWYFDNLEGPEVKKPPVEEHNWELVWSDEFDYTGLPNSAKWGYDLGGGGWGNNELQYYTMADTDNANVDGEKLTITAKKETVGDRNYTSARLITKNKGDWLYGRVEVRAKLPAGRGTWPAIWMLPTDWEYGGWPASGEIDIMEHVGYDEGVVHGTVHTEAFNHTLGTQVGQHITVADATSEYHVYALNWFENKIEIFVDDTKYFAFPYYTDWKKWPFDKRFHLILNIAVGGNWGGVEGVDDTIFPVTMEIDYVRVYKLGAESVYDSDIENKVKLYPNPVNNVLRVDFSEKADFTSAKAEIRSIDGKLVKNFTLRSNSPELNVSELERGVYFLLIKDNTQKISKKFIKK